MWQDATHTTNSVWEMWLWDILSFRVLEAIVIGLSDLRCAFNGIFKRSSYVLSGFHSSVFAKLTQQRSDVADRTDRRLGNM
jgi:hypothetical protein